jgi:hypothetical protein
MLKRYINASVAATRIVQEAIKRYPRWASPLICAFCSAAACWALGLRNVICFAFVKEGKEREPNWVALCFVSCTLKQRTSDSSLVCWCFRAVVRDLKSVWQASAAFCRSAPFISTC